MPRDRGFTMEDVLTRRFPALPAQLALDLEKVPASNDRGLLYHPCIVTLRDGTSRDFVYLAQSPRWLRSWAPAPDVPLDERHISVTDVVSVRESPNRLPPAFANELYAVGETGMGYTLFTVRFDDGSAVACVAGNVVDFIRYPAGKSAENVTGVAPDDRRDHIDRQPAPDHHWCIFERP